ncbi:MULTISPECIES: SDR family oxidoreductase [unclassified Dietzia]|uniref:SDR family oxidoreductase n=1 Tax=unclassified Dietzia TaxID=2617939 RepID=UPI000D213F1A|nr:MULTISPECIES: SDR family oxidoreductase [unclassified Dietzia]AVZ40180.1 NAD(P)-dependent dehydrogenase [Dietzia sp. JS16-p6b]QGW25631.1 short-chain dehydrogenase/reductase SDR [Dietzia sp. DQ12-45-1b]
MTTDPTVQPSDQSGDPVLVDPTAKYQIEVPVQQQPVPGLASRLDPPADHGEDSYVGHGRLTGRRALITGGDSGIGRAVAIAYAREGADVAIGYLPAEQSDADEVAELVRAAGRTCVLLPGDVGDEAVARGIVRDAVTGLGGLDVLVLNAARQTFVEHLEDLTSEQWAETMNVNISAPFWMMQEALGHLQPGSSVIFTSSVQAYTPSPGLVDYATSRAAVNTMSKSLAQQLAPRGIRVNAVAPGPFWTALQVSGGQKPEKLPTFGHKNPLGRPGQPVEMAGAYVYLASEESSYTTGNTLSVTGGAPTP